MTQLSIIILVQLIYVKVKIKRNNMLLYSACKLIIYIYDKNKFTEISKCRGKKYTIRTSILISQNTPKKKASWSSIALSTILHKMSWNNWIKLHYIYLSILLYRGACPRYYITNLISSLYSVPPQF